MLSFKPILLFLTSFSLYLPGVNDMNKIANFNDAKKQNETTIINSDNISFDFYSSSTQQFAYQNKVLSSPIEGEQKAIVKDFSSKEVDARFTISINSLEDRINGGFYVHSQDEGNNIDQADAFNIQFEKDPSTNHYHVKIFEFTNGAFVASLANTVEFAANKLDINVRITVNEEEINVFLNDAKAPSMNKKIKSFNKIGTHVGFRSFGAVHSFSNIEIRDKIEESNIPTVKVLMVGNSYAQDTMTYCHEIGVSQGVNMVCGVIYYGGCTFRQHVQFIEEKSAVYRYFKNGGTDKEVATFDDILFDEDWDYITVQTGNGEQGLKDTYYPYIKKLISYIEYNRPRAEVGLFQSWQVPSCFEHTGNSRLSKYDDNTEKMYQEIIRVTHEVKQETGMEFIVASSEIMHRINETRVCDDSVLERSFNRDSTAHLNENGRYMMGMLMYKTITGKYVDNVEYLPYGYSYGTTLGPNKDTADVIKETVEGIFDQYESMNHLVNPRAVESLKIDKYRQNYVEGDFFDYQSVQLMAVYEDGAIKQTNNFFIDITRALTLEDREITLTYQGKSITLPISVARK